MPQASDGEASVVNGKIYVMSGMSNPNLNLNQVCDPVTNQWSTKTPMPDRNGYCAASAAIGNKIYVIGGVSKSVGPNIMQIYDVTTDSWITGPSPPVSMGGYVSGAVTIGTPNASMIELFGLTGNASPYTNGSTANQIYDPTTHSWTVLSSMTTSRERFGLALLNNEVYTIGGLLTYYPLCGDVISQLQLFSTNERYTIPPVITMPTPTVTHVPATNSTLPTQSEPNLNVSTSELLLGVVVATLIITVSTIFIIAHRSKKSCSPIKS
jgi:hypothetical protein